MSPEERAPGPEDDLGPERAAAADPGTGDAPRDGGRGPVRKVAGWTLRLIAIAAAVTVLGLWAWLESADAERRLQRLLEDRATAALGSPVSIGSLELDVLPFRLVVQDVLARGSANDGVPLARIDAVRLQLSGWNLLQRRVTVTSLELDSPRLHLDTDSLELPREDGAAPGLAVELQRVMVRDGSLELNHRRARIGGELGGLSLTLAPAEDGLDLVRGTRRRGELRIDSGRLDLSQRSDGDLVLEPLDLQSRFVVDPDGVTVESFRLDLSDSWLRGSGQIIDPTSVELEVRGDVTAGDLFAFWSPPGPDLHEGVLRFVGTFQLRQGEPILGGRVAAETATIAGLPLAGLRADLQLREDEISVRNLDAGLHDGRLRGAVVVDRDVDPSRIRVEYELDGVDASDLTRWEPLPGLRLEGTLTASGEATWRQPWRQNVAGRGSLTLDLAPPPSVQVGSDAREEPGGQEAPTTGPPTAPTPGRAEERLVPTLPLAARAGIEYELRGGTLLLERSRLELPGTTIDVGGRVDLDGDLLLAATIDSRDLRMLDHLVAQYRAFADGRTARRRFGVSGTGRIELRVGGTVDSPLIGGRVTGQGITLGDLAIGAVAADVSTDGGLVTLEPLRIRRREGEAVGAARLRLPAPDGAPAARPGDGDAPPAAAGTDLPPRLDYRVDLRLDGYALRFELPLAGREIPLTGTTGGRYVLEGAWGGTSTMRFDLDLTAPTLGTTTLESGRFRATRREELWQIDELRVRGLGGELQAGGDWATAPVHRVDLEVDARSLDVRGLLTVLDLDLPFRGSLSGSSRLRGTLAALSGTGEARVADAAVGDLEIGSVGASLRAEAGVAAMLLVGAPTPADELVVPATPRTTTPGTAPALGEAPVDGWAAALTTATEAPFPAAAHLRADAHLAGSIFRQLGWRAPATMQLRGLLELRGGGPLPRPREWQVDGEVGGLRIERAGSTVATARRLELELRQGRVAVDLDLASGPGRLSMRGALELDTGRLSGAADGSLDLALLRLWRGDLRLAGAADSDITLAGSLDDPELSGTLRLVDASLTGEAWPYVIDGVTGRLELRADTLHLEDTGGRFGGRDFRVSGTIPLPALAGDPASDPLDVALTLDDLPLRPLLQRSPTVSRLVDSGTLSGDVRLRGRGTDWQRWSGSVDLRELRLQMGDYPLELAEPVAARLESGALVLPGETTLRGVRTDLQLQGRVELVPIRLDVRARGDLALEPLNVLSDVWGFGGGARVDMAIRGRPPELAYQGSAELVDAVLAPPPLRQPISRIRGNLDLRERRVVIEDVRGELGGGEVELEGEMFLRGSKPQSWRYTARVDDAQLRLERRVRVQVSADLVHDGTAERSLLSGDVELLEGVYRRDYQAEQAILELMESPETEPDPLLSSANLDLSVRGTDDLIIDNNLAQVEVTADFTVRGTLAEPVLLGRSTILSGELYWYDNTFEVMQGTVEFSNPFETEPIFEISARTTVRSYTVTLNFSGSFQRGMSFSYSSTPPLSDLELVNLLTLGTEPNSTVVQQSYEAAIGLQATRFLTEQYLAEVERGAQRFLGIDRFRIAPTLQGARTEPTARLTVGKQLSEAVYVTYSRLLDSSEEQLLTVEYQLTRDIRVTGTRDEDGSFGIDFLVQKRLR